MGHYAIPLARTVAPKDHLIGFGRQVLQEEGVGDLILDNADGGLVTIAGTGAGKGVSQVIPTALTYPGSLFVLDIKGEISAVTGRARREMGQQVLVLDPFGDGQTDALNPFELIDPECPDAYDHCCRLARMMVMSRFERDPFWDDTATTIISGTLLFLARHIDESDRTLALLYKMWGVSENLTELLALMLSCDDFNGSIKAAAQLYVSAPDKTRSSILTTLRNHIAFLFSGQARRSLDGGWGILREISEGVPMTVYLRVPPQMLKSHAALLRIWLGTIIAALSGRRARPEIPDLLLVDEAATLGHLDELLTAASLLRGYGLRTWTFWQSIGQLEGIYGDRSREFLDNASSLSMFGANNAASAERIAGLTGFKGQILGLPAERLVMCRQGMFAEEVQRLNYLKDKEYLGKFDANPFYRKMHDAVGERAAGIGREVC